MTDKKISELSSNGTLDGTELVPIVQSGSNVSNVKALLSAIRACYLAESTAASTYQTTANQRYTFLSDTNTSYIVPASAVTANGNTIIELSNNSLTSITINTATGTGKVAGDSVNISITGTYADQVLAAGGRDSFLIGLGGGGGGGSASAGGGGGVPLGKAGRNLLDFANPAQGGTFATDATRISKGIGGVWVAGESYAGDGGEFGQDGESGVSPFEFQAGASKGDNAIVGNSLITWLNNGSIYGNIVP